MSETELAERLDLQHTLVDGVLAGWGRCGRLSPASARGCPWPLHPRPPRRGSESPPEPELRRRALSARLCPRVVTIPRRVRG